MDSLDYIVTWLYSGGDMLMCTCRVIVFIFALEAMAYLISLVMGVAKCSKEY